MNINYVYRIYDKVGKYYVSSLKNTTIWSRYPQATIDARGYDTKNYAVHKFTVDQDFEEIQISPV